MQCAKRGKPNSKSSYCRIPLTGHTGTGKTVGPENRSVFARDWKWDEGLTKRGHERSLGCLWTVSCLDGYGGYLTKCMSGVITPGQYTKKGWIWLWQLSLNKTILVLKAMQGAIVIRELQLCLQVNGTGFIFQEKWRVDLSQNQFVPE